MDRAQLTAPRARGHGHPYVRAPLIVLPRLGDEPGGILRRWRLRIRPRNGRLPCLVRVVDGHPLPPDASLERAGDDPVDLPDRRVGQPATRVTGLPSSDAVFTAASQHGIEGLQ